MARYCRSPAANRWRGLAGGEQESRKGEGKQVWRCGGKNEVSKLHGTAGGAGTRRKMKFPELLPGNPDFRPDHVVACVARVPALVEEERNLELNTLLAVQLDARIVLSDEQVRRDALRQLRISEWSLRVTKIAAATFLLQFDDPALRTAALGGRGITVGHTGLHLRPWTRQHGAQASKIKYRVRLCLEGVPAHARHGEVVAPLLSAPSFVEKICDKTYAEKEKEKECLCVWIWTDDPTGIAKSGTLRIEEPIAATEEYLIHLGNMGSPYVRSDQAELLKYEVLIHIDQVQDFSTPRASPGYRSVGCDISGLPSGELEAEWPVKYRYGWLLGVPDGEVVEPRRFSVHDRQGGRRRDGSPPGGGHGDRFMHFTPPGHHDLRNDGRFAPSSSQSGGGHGCRQGRQVYRRRDAAAVGEEDLGEMKRGGHTQSGDGTHASRLKQATLLHDPMGAESSFRFGETWLHEFLGVDPMQEEAELHKANGIELQKANGPVAQVAAEIQGYCAPFDQGGSTVDKGLGDLRVILTGMSSQSNASEEQAREQDQFVVGVTTTLAALGTQEVVFDEVGRRLSDERFKSDPLVVGPSKLDGLEEQSLENVEAGGKGPDVAGLDNVGPMGDLAVQGGQPSKTLARFVMPVKKPVLQTPTLKKKAASARKTAKGSSDKGKKSASEMKAERRSVRIANRPNSNLTVEEQATALLIKKSGISGGGAPCAADLNKFHTQFVDPLEGNIVGEMRETFGLPEGGAADSLRPLLIDAEA